MLLTKSVSMIQRLSDWVLCHFGRIPSFLRLLSPLCSTQNHIQLKFPTNRMRVKSPQQVFLVQNLGGNIAWFFTFSLRRQCNKAALSEPVITIIILLQLPIFVPLRLHSVSTHCSCQFLPSMQLIRICVNTIQVHYVHASIMAS